MDNVFKVLENGYDCTTREEKAKNRIAKCLRIKGKLYRVVLAESYSIFYKCGCWVLVHVKPER